MADIDPISLNYLLKKKTKLNFPLDCDVFEEEKDKLSESQIKKIMYDLGKYLAELHGVKGNGFGLVNPRTLDKYELNGSHSSWYSFWADNFKEGFDTFNRVLKEEKRTKKHITYLSNDNRKLMHELLDKRKDFLKIFKENRSLIENIESRFINGNLYTKNMTLRNGKFVGLTDFSKALLGDPVDEFAYFSVMPGGDQYLGLILEAWKENVVIKNFEERYHIYRLIEAYRKIITRYVKHRYLDDYPEPLNIALSELNYYNIK